MSGFNPAEMPLGEPARGLVDRANITKGAGPMAMTIEQADEVICYALNQGGPEAAADPQRWAELMADGVRQCTDPGTDVAAALVEISEAIKKEAERQCADWAQRVYRALTELRGADELADPMSVAPRLAELVPSDENDDDDDLLT